MKKAVLPPSLFLKWKINIFPTNGHHALGDNYGYGNQSNFHQHIWETDRFSSTLKTYPSENVPKRKNEKLLLFNITDAVANFILKTMPVYFQLEHLTQDHADLHFSTLLSFFFYIAIWIHEWCFKFAPLLPTFWHLNCGLHVFYQMQVWGCRNGFRDWNLGSPKCCPQNLKYESLSLPLISIRNMQVTPSLCWNYLQGLSSVRWFQHWCFWSWLLNWSEFFWMTHMSPNGCPCFVHVNSFWKFIIKTGLPTAREVVESWTPPPILTQMGITITQKHIPHTEWREDSDLRHCIFHSSLINTFIKTPKTGNSVQRWHLYHSSSPTKSLPKSSISVAIIFITELIYIEGF